MGPGATVGVLGTGVPRLAACGLRRGSRSGPVRPIFVNTSSRPSRGAKPHGADDRKLPQAASSGWLARRRRDQGRVPRELLVMQAMTIKTRRAPACTVSLFPLWCKGGKHRCGVPRHQAKVAISVQRDQDQRSGRMEVTVEPRTASSPVPLAAEDQL